MFLPAALLSANLVILYSECIPTCQEAQQEKKAQIARIKDIQQHPEYGQIKCCIAIYHKTESPNTFRSQRLVMTFNGRTLC